MNFSRSDSKKNGEKILCRPGLGPKNKTLPGPNRDPAKLKASGLGSEPMENGITGTEPGPGLKILGPAHL
jgi:hypothetical protein